MNDINSKNNSLDTAVNNLTSNFVEVLKEALVKKDTEISYWKNKAYILFQYQNIGRLECPEHDTHIERSFDPWKVINEKECLTCKARKASINRGFNRQK